MSIIDLDLPQLRLVSGSGSAPTTARTGRYRQHARLGRQAVALYRRVLADRLAIGNPVDPDALRVVLAVHQARNGGRVNRFSATGIWQLLFVDVISWSKTHHLEVPEGVAPALVALVDHLAEAGLLDPASDPPQALYDAIDECTGGWE